MSAFTIVELLVVVSIIALLIAIAVPSFNRVRRQAKDTAVQASMSAIDTGLSTFQAETALGGSLPPSISDELNNAGEPVIEDPLDTSGSPQEAHISGASLLCYALAGPDKKGTVGFKVGPDGVWADNLGGYGSGGLYDPTVAAPAPRYGPYAGTRLMDSMTPLSEIAKGGQFQLPSLSTPDGRQLVFKDEFGGPILYYRARRAARFMIYNHADAHVGIYDHLDNALLTSFTGSRHLLNTTHYDDVSNYVPEPGTFDNFILDRDASTFENNDRNSLNSKVLRAVPQRADSYLLISAGADLRYGTDDDITNWKR